MTLALDMPLPLLPVQLLWLNLVTNGVQDLFLAFERNEPDILRRPPRPTDQPLFDRDLVEESIISGITIGLIAFGVFATLTWGYDLDAFEARNLTLLLMVLLENAHALSCRSERRSLWTVPFSANPLLVVGILGAQALHIASLYLPWWSDVLQVAPVTWREYLVLLSLTLVLLTVDELHKRLRHTPGTRSNPTLRGRRAGHAGVDR